MINIITSRTTYIIILLVLLILSGIAMKAMIDESARKTENYEILIGFKDTELQLKKSELSKMISASDDLQRVLRDSLNLKDRQILSIQRSTTKTKLSITTTLRDSIPTTHYQIPTTHYQIPNTKYPLPTTKYPIPNTQYQLPNTIKVFSYTDRWNNIHGTIYQDTIKITNIYTDSLTEVKYRYKPGKWFLPKLFHRWQEKTQIISNNPNATYTITQQIKTL